MARVGTLSIGPQDIGQKRGVEGVVAHRNQTEFRIPGHAGRLRGFLEEAFDSAFPINRNHTKGLGAFAPNGKASDTGLGADFQMKLNHLLDIHLVDVISAEHGYHIRPESAQQLYVLVDGIGRPPIPVITHLHLGGNHLNKAVVPGHAVHPTVLDVLQHRLCLVLGQNVDGGNVGVHQIAEHKIDNPIAPPERHRRLRPVTRQRV